MERVMAQLANNFALRQDNEVHIVLIGRKREVSYGVDRTISIHRPVFEFNNNQRQIDTIRTIKFLRSKVQTIDPDTVLSFGEIWNNLVLIALKGLDIPIFISDRSQPGKNLGRLHNYLRNKLYPKATGYIAQTQEAKEICLSKKWNSNVKVIGNPIRAVGNEFCIEKENIVLSVGRLIKTKHFDQLIKMFVEIGAPNWRLVIVGGDAKKQHLSKELKILIRKLGASDQVFLVGEQKDIDSYYNTSKIFAFTSSSEGFPNVVGEALSAGLPVVAYDCNAGPADMIRDGESGYLVPLFNQDIFKERLQMLMNNDVLREQMSRQTKIGVREFEVGEIANKFYEFISQCNGEKSKIGVDL